MNDSAEKFAFANNNFWQRERLYWQAAHAGLPTGVIFDRLVEAGRSVLETRQQLTVPGRELAHGFHSDADIAGAVLGVYEREATTHEAGDWPRERMQEHWAAAREIAALVGPLRLRQHLVSRAQYALGQSQASKALALLDQARRLASEPVFASGSGETQRYLHGDLRAVQAAALHQLYDSVTALTVQAPLERELRELLPNGPLLDEAARRKLPRRGQSASADHLLAASTVYHQVLDTKAAALRDTGHPAEAERTYLILAPHYEQQGLTEVGMLQLAACALSRKQPGKAGRWLDRAAPLFGTAPVSRDSGGDLTSMRAHLKRVKGAVYCRMRAECSRLQGQQVEALVWCRRGEVYLRAHPDHAAEAGLQTERARVHRALSEPASAAEAYRRAIVASDWLLRAPLGHRFDTLHLRFRQPLFDEALQAAQETDNAELATLVTDLLKARAFTARLALARTSVPAAPPPDEQPDRHEFHDLTERIGFAERQGQSELAEQLSQRRATLLTRIRAVDPRWQVLQQDPPFDPATLISYLAAYGSHASGTGAGACVALSLYEQGRSIVAALATADEGLRMAVQPLSKKTHRALDSHQRLLLSGNKPQPMNFWDDYGINLSDLIPESFADVIAAAGTCLLSPHGRLHALPWTAVRHQNRHLIRDTSIGVVPNLACIPVLDHRPCARLRVALVGVTELLTGKRQFDPVRRLLYKLSSSLTPDQLYGPPVIDRAADTAALRALLHSGPRVPGETAVLCLGTHGFAAPEAPFRGGVEMADGCIEAGEVSLGRMRFEEVVLVACRTSWRASTDRRGGHGALVEPDEGSPDEPFELGGDQANALVHAFQEAGAAFVLASPIPVWSRAASRYSEKWFGHRAARCTPLEASRRTAVELLNDDNTSEIISRWAGFTAYGVR
ncbi:CHAT domain-containing protein [Streptomyces sp. Tu 2975]|uniref:CHAT domain-containing protein n=1 Tax=Streptomyces sp. Tu 2975 TaxID=2676871 RepID=UPI001358B973|nr:CHAT domain-containing protein [Streptomyces sp. Tu 2975]QIP86700.1 CHAT domain-containing protein [Streptomyces sp. Tu 2975]